MLETFIAGLLVKFGKEMMDKYFERKDQWDLVATQIENEAKDYAITALRYLAAHGDLTYELRDPGAVIVPPATPEVHS